MSTTSLLLTDLYRPIRGNLAVVERVFDAELVSDFPFVTRLCEAVRSYRGKMLRPALLLLSGRATGRLTEAHHALAAVVEMVHMATLVHDDVLDEAEERRKQPTVGSVEGNTAAVLLGDYLISHAFHLCSGLQSQHASRRIGATTSVVCEGELLQNRHRGDVGLSEAAYLDIVGRKTGALTAVACELGAEFAGADDAVVAAMHEYGLSVGIAFQIVDDVLDIVGDPRDVGKTLGRDLAQGKLTLPTIHCLANASAATSAALRRAIDCATTEAAPRLRNWLDETGSLDYAISAAREFVASAQRSLELLPPNEARQSLSAMAEFIITRRY